MANPAGVEGNERRSIMNIQLGPSYVPLKISLWQKFWPWAKKEIAYDFYHANHLVLPNNQVFIMMQSPYIGGNIDNVDLFWYKVVTEGVEIMLSCVHKDEFGKNEHCATYYTADGNKTFVSSSGLVTVVCTSEVFDNAAGVTETKLEVKLGQREPHSLTLLSYDSWRKGRSPESTGHFVKLMPKLFSQKPVAIHSPHGAGRAGTVALIELCRQTVAMTSNLDLGETLKTVRRARAGAVETEEQLGFAYAVVIATANTVMEDPVFAKMLEAWEGYRALFYQGATNRRF